MKKKEALKRKREPEQAGVDKSGRKVRRKKEWWEKDDGQRRAVEDDDDIQHYRNEVSLFIYSLTYPSLP